MKKPYVPQPGADYHVHAVFGTGEVVYRRMGGKTWEYLRRPDDGGIPFREFKEQNAWIPMRLLIGPGHDVWLVRQNKNYKATRFHQCVAEGTQAELWPLFIAHARMVA